MARKMVSRLVPDNLNNAAAGLALWLVALGGADFEEVFGCDDGDDDAGPVGNGVAEEGAPVGGGIAEAVKQNP